ncbi:Glycosyltransferases involved in cell wall biogenesis [Gloeomargarita lithophora Alchichica-D10]|uniref:Glycosyltransferases involved in cell wall biogenesis n=1 Tax=Gloeomargarita lithophora Alchichica-D10 TaxID=1188229 RepID=A0A1J0AFV7_9CYAN|nr:Glycosyltransferases involved in cell wall biogenesis [Gloeomargarita lithophora Alchichica-D10]
MTTVVGGCSVLALLVWLVLWLGRGGFWRADQVLPAVPQPITSWPGVAVLIPARNEATTLPESLPSLLQQQYAGDLEIWLIDDQSTDGTGAVAAEIAQELGCTERLHILTGTPLPAGWSGKLWALEQGWQAVQTQEHYPSKFKYILLTDADICHAPDSVMQLVAQAQTHHLGLVSWMVLLRCESFWDRLLIPAFVFFFQKLYPFPWVNDPAKTTAAAAGGCILLEQQVLQKLGGFACLRGALIDDCTLAQRVKGLGVPVWLGLTDATRSVRPYGTLASTWGMVARTAFTQLHYSPWLLLGTLLGMGLLYGAPLVGWGWGLVMGIPWLLVVAGLTWGLMAGLYAKTLRWYNLPTLWGLTLPLAAGLYTLMTLDSARRHWQGRGGAWKGRVYPKGS